MGTDISEFVDALRVATRQIGPDYFRLPVYGVAEQEYRERVYCYELYHQLRRSAQQEGMQVLSGPAVPPPVFKRLFKRNMPDFLFHVPTRIAANLVFIRVKSINADSQQMEREAKALKQFTSKSGGRRAICLIYGDGESLEQFLEHMQSAVFSEGRLMVMWHRHQGESAELVRG